jgi:cytochrome d ubiquinol oxidase subunit I
MIVFTLVYGALAVVWFKLIHRYTVEGVPDVVHDDSPEARAKGDPDDPDSTDESERPLSFAY